VFDNIDEYLEKGAEFKPSKIGIKSLPSILTLMDVRYVCNAIFGIPVENQHVEIKMKKRIDAMLSIKTNGDGLALDYTIQSISNDYEYDGYISSAANAVDLVDGTPVDFEFYVNRDSYVIKDNTNTYIDLDNVESITVYNILDFITNTGRMLRILTDDSESVDILYHGFVEKFFPLIPISGILTLLSTGTIYAVYGHLKQ